MERVVPDNHDNLPDDPKELRTQLKAALKRESELKTENAGLTRYKLLADSGVKLNDIQQTALFSTFAQDEAPDKAAVLKRAEELGFHKPDAKPPATTTTVPPGMPDPNNPQAPQAPNADPNQLPVPPVNPLQQFVPQGQPMQMYVQGPNGEMIPVPNANPMVPGQAPVMQDWQQLAAQAGIQGLEAAEVAQVMANRGGGVGVTQFNDALANARSQEEALGIINRMGPSVGVMVDTE